MATVAVEPGSDALEIQGPTRTAFAASRTALGALLLRDLVVLRKNFWEFVLRTVIQPFLLCFVFLYVFPKIGQAIGSTHPGASASVSESAFATVLVAGVVGISIMFQGVQSVALQMAQEFGFTREIEDRVQAPCPIWLVAIAKVLSGTAQGMLSALIVLPIASVVHAHGVEADLVAALADHPHARAARRAWRCPRSGCCSARASSRGTSGSCSASSCCRSRSSAAPTTSGRGSRPSSSATSTGCRPSSCSTR